MSRLWYPPSQEAACQPTLTQAIYTEADSSTQNLTTQISLTWINYGLNMDLRNEINQIRNKIGQLCGTVQEIMSSQEAENDNHP